MTGHVVTVTTVPAGLSVVLDGMTSVITPAAFTVVEGAEAGQWETGSIHSLSAPLLQTNDTGVVYEFARWSPSARSSFALTASRNLPSYTAYYLPASTPEPSGAAKTRDAGKDYVLPKASGIPPSGPYLRLSDASLSAPVIGHFEAQGELFLSALEFHASLRTGAVKIPSNTVNLLEMGSGAWEVDYVAGSYLRLSSQPPQVYVLGKRTGVDTEMEILFEPNGYFSTSFSTAQDVQILPGVLEFAPGSITLSKDTSIHLYLSSTARILNGPQGWTVQQPLNLNVSDGPFSWVIPGLPNPLVRLPTTVGGLDFLELGNGTVTLNRNAAGIYSLLVDNYDMLLLEQPLIEDIGGSASSAGYLTCYGTVPPRSIDLTPSGFSFDVNGDVELLWNTFAPSIQITLPDLTLYHNTIPHLGDEGMPLIDGFTFDSSGDFDTGKIGLPTFWFDGVNINPGGALSNNHVRVLRRNGAVSLSLRDHRSFFASSMDLAFDINTAGSVSGSFSGDVVFDFKVGPLNLNDVTLFSMDMAYESNSDCQFEGSASAGGFTWGVCFGSSCFGICTDVTIGICPACYTTRPCIGPEPCP
jgi:hypothetical protein